MGKKSTPKTEKKGAQSSGKKYLSRCKRQLQRLSMKVARWKRNQGNPAKEKAGRSRRGWKTDRMEDHVAWLRDQLAKGKRNKKQWA